MFGQPSFGDSSGARSGTTGLIGSLAPVIMPGFQTRLAADIIAYPPLGVIGTTVSAGFSAGIAPPGSTSLATILAGTATVAHSLAETVGGHADTHSEISITIEEWTTLRGRRPRPVRLRAITSNPTVISNLWANAGFFGLGLQGDYRDNVPLVSAVGMPVVPGRQYVIIANLVQFAEYGYGLGSAISNIVFDFPPMFFAFS